MKIKSFLPVILVLLCGWQNPALSSDSLSPAHIQLMVDSEVRNPSGNLQSQNVGLALDRPLSVQVLDSTGNPVAGIPVDFIIAATPIKAHDTQIYNPHSVTDTQGVAQATLILGSASGDYVISASIPDSASQPNEQGYAGEEPVGEVFFKAHARSSNWVLLLLMGLAGGLALFLYGMEMMSEGMKKSAGDRMRSILAALTGHRVIGMMVGAFVTMVIQSSSATTVMLVSFVQAGLMSFGQSLGVILGADIGTTVTAQLIAFKLTDYALLMIAVGFAGYMFGRRETVKYIGEVVLGFGILFYGMHLMSQAMYPLRSHDGFINLLLQLENPLLGILVGAAFTALIQSSSAFTGIIIVLAQQGLLSLEAGIPLLFGANIGTCITAALASISTGREAKRVALAHTLFKIGGVLLFVFWIPTFASMIRSMSPKTAMDLGAIATQSIEVPRQIANAHTIFNLSLALIFLPFTVLFARLVIWILPKEDVPDPGAIVVWHLKEESIETPALAIDLARAEIQRLMKIIHRMLDAIMLPFFEPGRLPDAYHKDLSLVEGLDLREKKADFLDEKITHWLMRISRQSLPTEQAGELFGMMSVVKDLESIGDIVHRNVLPLIEKKRRLKLDFSQEGREELSAFHIKILKQMGRLREAFEDMDFARAHRVLHKELQYRDLEREFRQAHFERVSDERSESLETHEVHMELIDLLKQINLHQGNMAGTIIERMNWSRKEGKETTLSDI